MRLLRAMYWKALETVRAGGDPPVTIRDEAKNRLIVIPCYERLISEAEYKEMSQAAA